MDFTSCNRLYIGSLFQFSNAGRDELIAALRIVSSKSSARAFIGFDRRRSLLYVENVEPEHVLPLVTKYQTFLEHHLTQTEQNADIPSVSPLVGTTGPLDDFNDFEEIARNLCGSTENDEDFEDTTLESSLKETTIYWKPQCGNINILPYDVLKDISNVTECSFLPQSSLRRIMIRGDHALQALHRLQSSEKLFESIWKHQSGATSNMNANLWFPARSRVQSYVTLQQLASDIGRDRVLVDKDLEAIIEQLYIVKQWEYDLMKNIYNVPSGLDPNRQFGAVKTFGKSKLLTTMQTFSMGDEENSKPVLSSSGKRNSRSATQAAYAPQPSKYMGSVEQTRLAHWTQSVDTSVDPDFITATPTELQETDNPEDVNEIKDNRRVLEDSDTDSDLDDKKPVKKQLTTDQSLDEKQHRNSSSVGTYIERSVGEDEDEQSLCSKVQRLSLNCVRARDQEQHDLEGQNARITASSGSIKHEKDVNRKLSASSETDLSEDLQKEPVNGEMNNPVVLPAKRPANQVTSRKDGSIGSSNSIPSSNQSISRSTFYDYSSQMTIPKADINYAKNQTLARLMQMKENPNTGERISATTSQRKLDHDELKSRRSKNSMNLRAPNPGKKSKNRNTTTQETKKERQERIAKAKAEAHGHISTPQSRPSNTNNVTKEKPDKSKSTSMASPAIYLKQTQELFTQLWTLFNISQAYPGKLNLEIQLGQTLIAAGNDLHVGMNYNVNQWEEAFARSENKQQTFFTNLLTNNGHDIDHMLSMKASNGQNMWDILNPGPTQVSIELWCQEQNGLSFKIMMDQQGQFAPYSKTDVIGKSALHFPGHIWDGCVVLSGDRECFTLPTCTLSSVSELKSSIHVEYGDQTSIHFRTPNDSMLTVRKVILRRVNLHNCLTLGGEDVQMKVTECKQLYLSRHKRDPSLLCASEKHLSQMAEDRKVHFEVAVVHKSIRRALQEHCDENDNAALPPGIFAQLMLSFHNIESLVKIAALVVERIGGVGHHNKGTLHLKLQRLAEKQETTAQSLPFNALKSKLAEHGIHLPTLSGMNGSGLGASRTSGGEQSQRASELAPDDSASQAGNSGWLPPSDDRFRRTEVFW